MTEVTKITDVIEASMLRPLGKTGIDVSPLGLGTVKFGRNTDVKYPDAFQIPDDKTLDRLLGLTRELGINLLDTAPAYGDSEERLGSLLSNSRHEWIISTKVGEQYINGKSLHSFTAEDTFTSVENSLRKIRTDYLDVVLVHSDGRDSFIVEESGVFGALQKLKDKGHIRAFGLSGKTLEGGLLGLEHSDLAMVTYNIEDSNEEGIIDKAREENKGILIKKALLSGHAASPEQALKFVLINAGVSSVIVGSTDPRHLAENVRWACAAQNDR